MDCRWDIQGVLSGSRLLKWWQRALGLTRKTSNKFDFNKDGELQDDERHELRKELVQKTVDRYMSLPHKMKQEEVMPLIRNMTSDMDATVDNPAFLKNLKQLNNASSVSRTFDSKAVHRSVQPYPNLAKAPGTRNDDHNYGCVAECTATFFYLLRLSRQLLTDYVCSLPQSLQPQAQ